MKVALGSMFRNSTWYLDRYFWQIRELEQALEARGDSLYLYLAEGDSTDRTWEALVQKLEKYHHTLIRREHGSKHAWHSVDIPERWAAISWVCNGIIERVQEDPSVDVFIYVEADLVWTSQAMLHLIDDLTDKHPAIAPLVFAGEWFYDLWGHIGMNGAHFGPFPPYHDSIANGDIAEIYSAGSCIAMRGDVARSGIRWDSRDHCRGLGRMIRANGFSLWVDPHVRLEHP